MKHIVVLAIGSVLGLSASAQANPGAAIVVEQTGTSQAYQVTVISRSVQAVNYRHNGGATEVDFAGTALLPSADGRAKVRSKRGTLEVQATFGNLQRPTVFGSEYLTYVMWAISPEGRPVNLGEVLLGENDQSKLTATTDLQAFALIVTAEPYYAVRQPSNVVVLENVVRDDTKGTTEAVNAKYELMERGGYTDNVGGDVMNQTLSENRTGSVRDYLVQQGVSTNSVTAKGFGNTLPVASNENSSGRQENRRVELLVSGDAIGSPANVTTGSLR